MPEMYTVAIFNSETGEFVRFPRKGRDFGLRMYDNLGSARRGRGQSHVYGDEIAKIIKLGSMEIIE